MFDVITIVSKAEQALNLLRLVSPVIGDDNPIVEKAADIVGRALSGVKFGLNGYNELVKELNGVIADLEAIKAKGLTGDDFRDEVAKIESRGLALDGLKLRLEG